MNDTDLIAFKTIVNFINELNEQYGKKQRSLKLYHHLINKTTISHEVAIQKHIQLFRNFCISNRDQINNKEKKLVEPTIKYSDKAVIDLGYILTVCDDDDFNVIWKHMLALSALLDPSGRAKELLKKNLEDGVENDFLTNIINKVEEHIDPNDSNPMNAVNSILKSGVFTDLMTNMTEGISNGSLNLGKLMGAIQNVTSGMVPPGTDTNMPAGFNPMDMISSMMGNLTTQETLSNNMLPQLPEKKE